MTKCVDAKLQGKLHNTLKEYSFRDYSFSTLSFANKPGLHSTEHKVSHEYDLLLLPTINNLTGRAAQERLLLVWCWRETWMASAGMRLAKVHKVLEVFASCIRLCMCTVHKAAYSTRYIRSLNSLQYTRQCTINPALDSAQFTVH